MTRPAPLPSDETRRLDRLRMLAVLDSRPEAIFDMLTALASTVCGTPIALVSLVDADRQWFKSNVGLAGVAETPRDVSFCAYTLHDPDLMEVADATRDERFADNPLVTGSPGIRFYAGAPIAMPGGEQVGALCVIDRRPRTLTDRQRELLRGLAAVAAEALALRERMLDRARDLAQSHELLRVTLRSIAEAVITTDADGRVESLNPVAEAMTGWPAAEARGLPLARVLDVADGPHPVLVSRDGIERGIDLTAAPIHDDRGATLGSVLIFRDVTEQRRASREMRHRATHDALTGLVNRAEFEIRLQRALAENGDDASALMFIDLDRFKAVNDACGHAAGDRLLCQIGVLLRGRVRSHDTLARLGGDEFAVLLEHCDAAGAGRVAQDICDRMDAFRFVDGGRSFRVGTSIGLVPIDRRWPDAAAAMRAADASCYAAKAAGRNRVHAWRDDDETHAGRQRETQWATRLVHACDDGRFRLQVQRVVPLAPAGDRRPHGEVLVWLPGDDGTPIAPSLFLPAAQRFGIVAQIDRWVVECVVGQLAAGHPALHPLAMVGVNLSGPSIGDPTLPRHVAALVAEHAVDPERLCFEVDEAVAVAHPDEASTFAAAMRDLGVRIAIDDAGGGTSSFAYLKRLAVDWIKIDGRLVRGLTDGPLDRAAVSGICGVANAIGARTVAKAVESDEVLARARDLGIDRAQGFALHRPEPL